MPVQMTLKNPDEFCETAMQYCVSPHLSEHSNMIFKKRKFGYCKEKLILGMIVGVYEDYYLFLTEHGIQRLREDDFIPAPILDIYRFKQRVQNTHYCLFLQEIIQIEENNSSR